MADHQRLLEVLDYIRAYTEENGFSPTVRDMCRDLGIRSTATAYDYINRLRDLGYLDKAENKKRALVVRGDETRRIPLLGDVAAGKPLLAVENFEGYYPLSASEFKGDQLFMLRVRGTSMIDAGILDGDKVIVRKQETADDGEIVVVLYDEDGSGHGGTVKRIYRRGGKVILHPENETMADIVLDEMSDAMIVGKVIGLLRTIR